jgi:hypothetical protein
MSKIVRLEINKMKCLGVFMLVAGLHRWNKPEAAKMRYRNLVICLLMISCSISIFSGIAYCKGFYGEESYGWIKKETINTFIDQAEAQRNDYIYSEPNLAEVYRIGYVEPRDRVLTLGNEMIDGEEWVHVQFPEWLLLKNRSMKSKLILGQKEFLAQSIGMGIGGIIAYEIATHSTNDIGVGIPVICVGAFLGFWSGSTLVESYNHGVIDKYKIDGQH